MCLELDLTSLIKFLIQKQQLQPSNRTRNDKINPEYYMPRTTCNTIMNCYFYRVLHYEFERLALGISWHP